MAVVVASGALAGLAFNVPQGRLASVGIAYGVLMSGVLGAAELFVLDGPMRVWLNSQSFTANVLIRSAIYVALIPSLGIYVCSIAIIAVFMRWLGNYGWGLTAAVSIAVPAVFYMMFEKWFLVPLPKGPIEDLLGL